MSIKTARYQGGINLEVGINIYTLIRKIPWRMESQPTPVFLHGEFHEQRSLESYSPRGHKESDMTERLTHTAHVIISIFPCHEKFLTH